MEKGELLVSMRHFFPILVCILSIYFFYYLFINLIKSHSESKGTELKCWTSAVKYSLWSTIYLVYYLANFNNSSLPHKAPSEFLKASL